ncbi:MAG: GDP-mannose 4,6-dehydratase [Nanoarchaeota archaeon]|nr:GDP-mannose 4,6-dehydratase [Nanoarchaeota archaeon]
MKNVVITGGAGFIGSHLCKYLLDKGEKVVCVDNLFTGSKKNILSLMNDPNFRFIEQDIIEPLYIDEKIDQIYNLACPASPIHYQFNAIRTIKANTIGVINMLGLARKHNARILQASTSEIYGDPLEHPQKETYRGNVNTLGPRACYDEGKRVAETLFMDYHRKWRLDIRIVRIFNTYGTSMNKEDGRVVSNFIVQALKNENLTIYGDGSQTRSFCYVSDLIEGMYKMMNQENFIGPVNLGNPGEFTILELAKKIINFTSSNSNIVYHLLPQDDPIKRKPDISLAREKLNWEPKIPLEDGLKKTIDYFKELIKMNCLVTGGAGFIGSNLVDRLLKENYKVIVIDDLSTGRKENILAHIGKENFVFYEKSICDNLDEIFERERIEVVFHLAALPRVQFSIVNPIKTNEVNVNGTLNLLQTCKKFDVKRFVFSSSSSVYGDQEKLPLIETMPLNPMSPYALHKLTSEEYCKLFNLIHGLETISLRYFNVFGPRQNPEGDYACLIPKFIECLISGKEFTVNGNGEQTRDFTFVEDVVNANILAATTQNKDAFGKAFNIGNNHNLSVNEVMKGILNLSNKNTKIIYGPAVIEPRDTLADNSKAREFLGWAPKVSFEEGIRKELGYFRVI